MTGTTPGAENRKGGCEIPDETRESRSALEATPGRLRVLVVEDSPDNAQGLAALVELWGHEARIAVDGESALVAFRRFEPRVVLADIGLPGLDGYELARRLRRLDRGAAGRCVLVALTGYGQPRDRDRAFEAGFDHHLTKPVDPGRLEELLAECRVRYVDRRPSG